jgi:hypothetical protein
MHREVRRMPRPTLPVPAKEQQWKLPAICDSLKSSNPQVKMVGTSQALPGAFCKLRTAWQEVENIVAGKHLIF